LSTWSPLVCQGPWIQSLIGKKPSKTGSGALPIGTSETGRCETLLVQGEPPKAIIGAAEDFEADLIVMATHGHTGLNRALLGSTTERVVRESPVPVLTVNPKQHSAQSRHKGKSEK